MDLATVNHAVDEAAGKAQQSQGRSVQSFVASLAAAATILGVAVVFFVMLKDRLPRIL